ncbi:unnamed protein product [Trifolium pratense]|uniref:Uncharacterized protein n=1 Tax=Trifolium pratense TaxID=57577 RepID=A0ACB0LT04_TRIPR|nr:unnamed protein product [Trifolium pratense]
MFSAGFISIGQNAYSFAIWFTEPNSLNHKNTIVWMANRDQPVNGKRSKLTLLNTGNIVLLDVSLNNVWSSKTSSLEPLELHLKNDGNLVLLELQGTKILWQSFDSPTDTLVPGQPLTRYTKLVASRSDTNHSSGFYQFFFDDENILGLHYNGRDVSSSYWPKPWLLSWDVGRSNFNSSRIAVLGSFGEFYSSDNFTFTTSDYGSVMQRIMKLDSDGVVRVYSRINVSQNWYVSWQAFSGTCTVHGVCGANSTCSYSPKLGRKCSCIPGYRMKNPNDWSYGCEPMFDFTCNKSESTFLEMKNVEFYGYDFHYIEICNFSTCVDLCLQDCNCKAFQFSYWEKHGFYRCFTKTQLQNGRYYPIFKGSNYLRLPKGNTFSLKQTSNPSNNDVCSEKLQRVLVNEGENHFVKFFLWFATAIGAFQTVCIFVIWCSLFRSNQKTYADQQGYHLADIGFRKFSYLELKKATKGFSQEIGRGGGGVVYKGLLSDERHAAIKRLYNAQQGGEGEFLAEVGIIGRLNHMNLIEMWGYCAEGKYRLLVYEYMENGSLAENLSSNKLDWSKRFKIALAIARVLAYLHEECLEWILHCDIKPQNILLDSNFQPKLADFGLSKLKNRNNLNNSSVSMIRGTRGYMAPEWIFNLPITSKVDVYSYGIVVLEMITGKSPTTGFKIVNGEEESVGRLVTWVREKRGSSISWLEEIVDPNIGLNYDKSKMEILAKVALDCVVDERDSRSILINQIKVIWST